MFVTAHCLEAAALEQDGDWMGTVGLSSSVLSELCEKFGFRKINKIAIESSNELIV